MKLTWFGHSAFRLDFATASVLIDPFLNGNPSFAGSYKEAIEGVSIIALTHGHNDHFGDTLDIAHENNAVAVANAEICGFISSRGHNKVDPMNKGGTVHQSGLSITMVEAKHSSSFKDEKGVVHHMGEAAGLIVSDGMTSVYHLGDTDIFTDMGLIFDRFRPTIGLVPIGDRFTMGQKDAARAVNAFMPFETVIPCHYKTFPIIDQDHAVFEAELDNKAAFRPMEVSVPISL
ncbi:MAG: metal-dependent hydrolase [Pseudomonadota bacterium]